MFRRVARPLILPSSISKRASFPGSVDSETMAFQYLHSGAEMASVNLLLPIEPQPARSCRTAYNNSFSHRGGDGIHFQYDRTQMYPNW